ncbi:MAG: cysteine--tRNA ligase [Eubacteriales bacterium]|nr:cysteine--tRNA ligase [Eubacteriales bacterium]MDD4475699.1 cysteine--tRNA ligase [Eubacteriales bacterium]
MKLYNSLTRSKEDFHIKDKTVRMYACGPTVYNYFHVGNARCFVVFDMLRRYLEYRGNKVIFVQNFTDVDDKMIKRAALDNASVSEVADRFIKEYFTDAGGLGIRPATYHPRATENIEEIIKIIEELINKGHAYVSTSDDGKKDVYFSAESFDEYGKLSNMPIAELEAGARIDVNEVKNNPMDFALWKAKKEGEISWSSPWGEGRPGWHIECSAMVYRYLGEEIDIHCGGADLMFPHHENEIAQSECATGHIMSRFWLHNGFINVDNKKMSKSGSNSFMVRDAAKQFGYLPIRYFLLASHYRTPINFSEEILEQAKSALTRLHNCADLILFNEARADKTVPLSDAENTSLAFIAEKKQSFIDAMDDDFNTADAIAALFEITRDINSMLAEETLSAKYLETASKTFFELLELFGFEKPSNTNDDEEKYIEDAIARRAQAKKNKDYALADSIRNELKERGITLEDTAQGTMWKKQ